MLHTAHLYSTALCMNSFVMWWLVRHSKDPAAISSGWISLLEQEKEIQVCESENLNISLLFSMGIQYYINIHVCMSDVEHMWFPDLNLGHMVNE